jgi:hypothetical protein
MHRLKALANSFPVYIAASYACIHHQWRFVSVDYAVVVHHAFVIAALAAFVLRQAQYLGFVATGIAHVKGLAILFGEVHVGAAFRAYVRGCHATDTLQYNIFIVFDSCVGVLSRNKVLSGLIT